MGMPPLSLATVNPARAGMILAGKMSADFDASKPRASGDDPEHTKTKRKTKK